MTRHRTAYLLLNAACAEWIAVRKEAQESLVADGLVTNHWATVFTRISRTTLTSNHKRLVTVQTPLPQSAHATLAHSAWTERWTPHLHEATRRLGLCLRVAAPALTGPGGEVRLITRIDMAMRSDQMVLNGRRFLLSPTFTDEQCVGFFLDVVDSLAGIPPAGLGYFTRTGMDSVRADNAVCALQTLEAIELTLNRHRTTQRPINVANAPARIRRLHITHRPATTLFENRL